MSYKFKRDVTVERRLLAGLAINAPSWQSGKDYLAGDMFVDGGILYLVTTSHTSTASPAADIANLSQAGGDNLGNHVATQDLNMSGFEIHNWGLERVAATTDTAIDGINSGSLIEFSGAGPYTLTLNQNVENIGMAIVRVINASTSPLTITSGTATLASGDVTVAAGGHATIYTTGSNAFAFSAFVPVEDLRYAFLSGALTTSTDLSSFTVQGGDASLVDIANDQITGVEGRFRILVYGYGQSSSNFGATIRVNGAGVATIIDGENVTGGFGSGYSAEWIGDLVATDVVTIEGVGGNSSLTYILVQQVATKSVVIPDALPVEDLNYVSLAITDPSSGFSPIPTAIGAGYEVADIDSIAFVVNTNAPAWINGADNSITIGSDGTYRLFFSHDNDDQAGAAIWVDGVRVAITNETNGLASESKTAEVIMPLTAGQKVEFGGQSAAIGFMRAASITVQQIPSKTVINTTDTPVNDQAASGYMDIGNMRIQWGTETLANGTADVVNFPAPFGAVPSITLSPVNRSGAVLTVSSDTETTTSFVAERRSLAGTPTPGDISWQAIGLKP